MILHRIYARCKKMSGMKVVRFRKINKLAFKHFFINDLSFNLFIKNAFMKIKSSIFPLKYTKYGKMLGNKIVYFKKIYNFSLEHFYILIISFVC